MDLLHFLSQLSRIVFEPIFGVMIAGMLLALLLNFRRRGWRFYAVLIGVGFMLVWRSCLHLLSKRYSEILIYVGIGFSGYFLLLFPAWFACRFRPLLQRYCPKAEQVMRRFPRLIGRVLIFVLILICFGKLSRYNRYDDTIPKSSEVVKQDAANFRRPLVLELCGEQDRLHYYSGLSILAVNQEASREEQWKRCSQLLKREHDAAYLFCKERREETHSLFPKGAVAGDWELIFSAPQDNRRKLWINVYRCRNRKK